MGKRERTTFADKGANYEMLEQCGQVVVVGGGSVDLWTGERVRADARIGS